MASRNRFNPLEELGGAKAAIRCASHALAQACDRLNAVAAILPDETNVGQIADKASDLLTLVHKFEDQIRKASNQVREMTEAERG